MFSVILSMDDVEYLSIWGGDMVIIFGEVLLVVQQDGWFKGWIGLPVGLFVGLLLGELVVLDNSVGGEL